MRGLLDVSVLIALLDENHTGNAAAETWLARNIQHGWASCPLTQNGCVRILSQAAYPNTLSVTDAVMRLRSAISTPHHVFVPDNISLLDDDRIDFRDLSQGQLTDAYLLALAVEHRCRLVTLDTRISLAVVPGAESPSLVVI